MSVESVMARIAEIQMALVPAQKSAGNGNFQAVLGAQTGAAAPTNMGAPATGVGWNPAGGAGGGGVAAMLQAASAEVGQAEQPPGSNDSPRIAQYRAATAQPGDLIVWGSRHIGIVESVDPNGSIHTIEGNSSDQVSRRTYGPDGGGATGYVRLS